MCSYLFRLINTEKKHAYKDKYFESLLRRRNLDLKTPNLSPTNLQAVAALIKHQRGGTLTKYRLVKDSLPLKCRILFQVSHTALQQTSVPL